MEHRLRWLAAIGREVSAFISDHPQAAVAAAVHIARAFEAGADIRRAEKVGELAERELRVEAREAAVFAKEGKR